VFDRWIPVVAAVLGVLGGMGGALVGGSIANSGQEQRFENERRAARHDLRQDAYANYLQTAYGYLLQIQLKDSDVPPSNEELAARLDATVGAEAAVALYANPKFQALSGELTNALAQEQVGKVQSLLKEFTNLAKADLAAEDR
jgi:hypothetical protein